MSSLSHSTSDPLISAPPSISNVRDVLPFTEMLRKVTYPFDLFDCAHAPNRKTRHAAERPRLQSWSETIIREG
jgi:hypothetical protein